MKFIKVWESVLSTTAGKIWLLICFTYGFFIFTMIWPWNIMQIEEPFKVISKPVVIGDYLEYELRYCKSVNMPGHVTIQLLNSHAVTVAEFESNVPAGCGVYKGKHKLRERWSAYSAGPGYVVSFTVWYEPWPWVKKSYTFKSEKFDLVGGC